MSQTVRFAPTAIIYADGNCILSSETIGVTATSSPTATVMADTVTRINAAITEVNTYFWLYGYAVSPNLPQLPAVPSSNPPANAIFYQNQSVGRGSPGISLQLVDLGQTSGDGTPRVNSLDPLLTEPNLHNIKTARTNLDTGKS